MGPHAIRFLTFPVLTRSGDANTLNFMSVSAPRFVTCLCNTCSGKIEFERAAFDPRNPNVITCPHCGLETQLYLLSESGFRVLPGAPDTIARASGVLPPSPSPGIAAPSSSKNTIAAAPPIIQRPPVSTSQFFHDLCKWGILIWTALCAMGGGYGLFNVFVLKAQDTSRSLNVSPTATSLGIIAGMSIWGIVWCLVAIPGTVLWLITRPPQK
jgi:hypothetical protein